MGSPIYFGLFPTAAFPKSPSEIWVCQVKTIRELPNEKKCKTNGIETPGKISDGRGNYFRVRFVAKLVFGILFGSY